MRLIRTVMIAVVVAISIAGPLSTHGLASSKNAPSDNLPGRRVGAGVRQPDNACMEVTQTQVAIIPVSNLGVTAQAQPTLLFYVPAVNPERTLEFVLRDENDQEVYDKTVAATGEGGIIRLDLSEEVAVSLEPGKNYQWYFSVICNSSDRSQDISSYGWIRRVDTGVAVFSSPPTTDLLSTARSYAEAGMWLDALAELDSLRRTQPSNPAVSRLWEEWLLLPTLNLASVTQANPISSPFNQLMSRSQN
ncbi:hypothetical protein C7271_15685 [filamentous cyanobacterium CCP5]|nr:hypothetical protein C7271_15685 [filamentous cyanobacterium CCP5]